MSLINFDIQAKAAAIQQQADHDSDCNYAESGYICNCLASSICPNCGAHVPKVHKCAEEYHMEYGMHRRCSCGFFHGCIGDTASSIIIPGYLAGCALGLLTLGLWGDTGRIHPLPMFSAITFISTATLLLINAKGGTMELIRLIRKLFGLNNSDAKLDAVLDHLKLKADLVPEHYKVESTDSNKDT